MVLSTLVRKHDRSFVVHLLEPAINLCLYGDLCNLGVQYRYGRSCLLPDSRGITLQYPFDSWVNKKLSKKQYCKNPQIRDSIQQDRLLGFL